MQDARLFGADEETVAAIEAAENEEQAETAIWPENWQTVLAFAAVITQWRVVPLASGRLHYSGLDYAAVRAGLLAEEIEVTPALWADLRTMELAAREAANSR